MKKIIIMALVGAGLFVGTVLGLLASSDRLNYKGTQGIPVLESLFTDPDAEEKQKAADALEAEQKEKEKHAPKHPVGGPSRKEPEPAGGGGHGGGHAAPSGETHETGIPEVVEDPKIKDALFDPGKQGQQLSGGARYFPGGYFRFPSLDDKSESHGGPDPLDVPIEEELNRRLDALKSRRVRLSEREAKVGLDEKGQKMRRLHADERAGLVDQKAEFLKKKTEDLDAEIEKFQKRVILIKSDERPGLTSYAKELEGMVENDPAKAATLVRALLGLQALIDAEDDQERKDRRDPKIQRTSSDRQASNISPAEASKRRLRMMKALSLMSPDSFGSLLVAMTAKEIKFILREKLKVATEPSK